MGREGRARSVAPCVLGCLRVSGRRRLGLSSMCWSPGPLALVEMAHCSQSVTAMALQPPGPRPGGDCAAAQGLAGRGRSSGRAAEGRVRGVAQHPTRLLPAPSPWAEASPKACGLREMAPSRRYRLPGGSFPPCAVPDPGGTQVPTESVLPVGVKVPILQVRTVRRPPGCAGRKAGTWAQGSLEC